MSYSSMGKWADGLGEMEGTPESEPVDADKDDSVEVVVTHLAPDTIESLSALGAADLECSCERWVSGREGALP
jgi:hypothetical protein